MEECQRLLQKVLKDEGYIAHQTLFLRSSSLYSVSFSIFLLSSNGAKVEPKVALIATRSPSPLLHSMKHKLTQHFGRMISIGADP